LNARAFRHQFQPSLASTFLIHVQAPDSAPMIVTQPQGGARPAGASILFRVTANANPAPSYQWFKDGLQIGGNSPTLFIDQLKADDAGSYEVVVSNSAGSLTSSPAPLFIVGNEQIFSDRFQSP
jgi:beta-galactosidase